MTRRQKPYGTNIGTGKWILGLSAVLLAICVMPVHSNATQARSSGAQAATAPSEFDVTSVKPRTGAPVIGGASAGTRFHRPDITLRQLIVFAYDLPPFRVVGGPDWVASDRWDVDARVAMPASREQMRLLVQRLLADRFGLEARLEGRDLPVLLVQLVNSDGRLGKQLRRSSLDCTSRSATDQDAGSVDGNGFPLCAAMTARQTTTSRTVTIRGNPLSVILRRLEVSVGQPLIDRTGLSGNFDAELTFALQQPAVAAGSAEAPVIRTAFQEQLGLRLEPARGPVEVLVIEGVERPRAD
jgi:uncharacterized protein (TIGR03435 family)